MNPAPSKGVTWSNDVDEVANPTPAFQDWTKPENWSHNLGKCYSAQRRMKNGGVLPEACQKCLTWETWTNKLCRMLGSGYTHKPVRRPGGSFSFFDDRYKEQEARERERRRMKNKKHRRGWP